MVSSVHVERVVGPRGRAPLAHREPASPAGVRSRPRVLFFCMPSHEDVYGGTRSLLMALAHLRDLDAVVVAALPSQDHALVAELRRIGVAYEIVLVPPRRRGRLGLLARARAMNRVLLPVFRRLAPDAVHANAEEILFSVAAARRAGCPLVMHVRGVQPGGRVSLLREALMTSAHRVVFITDSLRAFYVAGVRPWLRARLRNRSVTIHNGLPLGEIRRYRESVPRERARRELGMGPGEIAVVLVGGLFPAKGQLPFLRTVAPGICRSDPRVRIWVVGGDKDSAYADACRAAVRDAALEERVEFTGFRTDIFAWFRAMDILAFPSEREGFGRVVVEAQAFGVPVVASDIVGVRDALRDGDGGYLVSTPGRWVQTLTDLAGSPALRRECGDRGRAFAERFDAERVTRDLERFYADLLG